MTVKNTKDEQWTRRILVAVDGSENSSRAAKVAVTLAKKFGAELLVCHAIPMPSSSFGTIEPKSIYFDPARKNAKTLLNETVKLAETGGVKASELLIEGLTSVVEAIVSNASNHNVDLIVIGTRGRTGFKKLLMGSVSSGVLNHAHCSVLVVR
jgi:nucleotide-binding universal stress UspA family protein